MPSHLGHGMNVPYLDRSPKAQTDYHTVTNLPFEIKPKVTFRYEIMNRPTSVNLPFLLKSKEAKSPRSSVMGFTSNDKEMQDQEFKQSGIEYAKFLKEHERTLGPVGFLDSKRYTHTFNVKSAASSPRTNIGMKSDKEPATVVALTNRIAADQKEFDKRMKVIEDHMWQHKQEERGLKRVEGDVTKKKRGVLRMMREFENSMSKKMLEEEKRLNESIEHTKKIRAEAVHAKEEGRKRKITKTHSDLQQTKDKLRKNVLLVTDAERQYRAKLTELELRKDQMQKLTREFEDRLKRKETERYNLAKELSNLAIQMNMESMKGRIADAEFKRQDRVQAQKYINDDKAHQAELDKKIRRSESVYRSSENRRRQASAHLSDRKAHLSERSREGDRRVTDNRNLVEGNIAAQKKLQEAAEAAELDKRKKEYQRNVQAHVVRKQVALRKVQTARQKSAQERTENWEKVFDQNHREFVRKRNDDLLRTFTRIVQRDNEIDHQLYQKCRQHEYGRKSQEQSVRKLEEQFVKSRGKNAGKVREAIKEADEKENRLKKKLTTAQAQLIQAQNQRSTAEWMLRKYRGAAKETELVQNELMRENKRLLKIGSRTDTYLEQQAVPAL
uniref:major antigen-like n=1 Tax=Ciona intestinalis TaxID=7719 RepID=UPI000521AE2E|nr:major antigen-like [Ciona intestinalis]|eukprot:XP_009858220.1 major antigen-like [Ciona intestinalis]